MISGAAAAAVAAFFPPRAMGEPLVPGRLLVFLDGCCSLPTG